MYMCSSQRWDIKVQYSLNPEVFTPIIPFSVVWQKQGAFSIAVLPVTLLRSQECKYPWDWSAQGLPVSELCSSYEVLLIPDSICGKHTVLNVL